MRQNGANTAPFLIWCRAYSRGFLQAVIVVLSSQSLALATDCMFFRAWYWLHVFPRCMALFASFPRLALIACFPALLGTDCMFSALGTGCMFSRAWRWLHVFPSLALVVCFLCMVLVACFPALKTGYMYFISNFDWFFVLFMCVVMDNNVFHWLNSTTEKRSIYLQFFSKKLDMLVMTIKGTRTYIDEI